eukprot:scaffold3966_cov99-Cylindrotheca_fusiformis.AAC.3
MDLWWSSKFELFEDSSVKVHRNVSATSCNYQRLEMVGRSMHGISVDRLGHSINVIQSKAFRIVLDLDCWYL